MKYNQLGNSGLKVSQLCMGTMTFGDTADRKMSQNIYSMCRDYGINFFDCANVYADGESERILGKLAKDHREQVIITSKAYFPVSRDVNDRGLSRSHLIKELHKSLRRLETDYIDVYYCHAFDKACPLEETLSTLDSFVKQGKIRYIGLSNFAAWQVMKAIAVTKSINGSSIACIQPMYNLLKRQCESEILPMAGSEGLGVVPYSPLGGGLLTGKYLVNEAANGRFHSNKMYQKRYFDDVYKIAIENFITFAKDHHFNPVALAIAWSGSHPHVTSPIIGARNIEQLMPALSSLEIDMSQELRNELSDIFLSPAIATDRREELENIEYKRDDL